MPPEGLVDLDGPVTEVVRTDYTALGEDESVEQALRRLRGGDIGERIIYFYVTDAAGRLTGVVPTRRLLLAPPDRLIRDVMVQPVIWVPRTASIRQAMEVISRRRLLAVPVVDENGALTGVVDVAQYAQTLDFERRETAEELFQLVGVHVELDRLATLGKAFRNRFPWLLCNIGGGTLAALITGAFSPVLQAAVAVAFFIPVVLAVSESVSMQSAALAVRSLHLAGAGWRGPARSTARQLALGGMLGLSCGTITGLVGGAWLGSPALGAVVGGGIAAGACLGAAIGHLLPRQVHRWRLDPAVASGPAALALTDLAAIIVYLALAAAVLAGGVRC